MKVLKFRKITEACFKSSLRCGLVILVVQMIIHHHHLAKPHSRLSEWS